MYLAYLDPGSGSMLMAAIVAGAAGVAVTVRVWWRRLFGRFRRQQATDAQSPTGPAQDG
jgi:uncharacterized protein (DUF2062 family)